MQSRLWLVGVGVGVLMGAACRARAGGNSVAIARIHGKLGIRSIQPGGPWRRAKPGILTGTYLLRTGPCSWAHLEERGGWLPRRFNRGCVDARSLLRVESSCGFHIQVLRGQISAVDGRRGESLFGTVGG